jgi:succinate-acetate transporter protein
MAVQELGSTEKPVREHAHIFLQPVAGASILGLLAFAAASFVFGAQYAGWKGFADNAFLGPILVVFFGLAQFAAAMWAYRAREGLSTAFHGMWGAYWVALGAVSFVYAARWLTAPAAGLGGPVGYGFLALAFVSGACAAAALATNFTLFCAKLAITGGSIAFAVGMLTGSAVAFTTGGYLFIVSAALAWYTSTAMMFEDAFGRVILPLGEFRAREAEAYATALGEPGVWHGEWHAHKPKHAARV